MQPFVAFPYATHRCLQCLKVHEFGSKKSGGSVGKVKVNVKQTSKKEPLRKSDLRNETNISLPAAREELVRSGAGADKQGSSAAASNDFIPLSSGPDDSSLTSANNVPRAIERATNEARDKRRTRLKDVAEDEPWNNSSWRISRKQALELLPECVRDKF